MTSRALDVRRRLPGGPFATDGSVVKLHPHTTGFGPLRGWSCRRSFNLKGASGKRGVAPRRSAPSPRLWGPGRGLGGGPRSASPRRCSARGGSAILEPEPQVPCSGGGGGARRAWQRGPRGRGAHEPPRLSLFPAHRLRSAGGTRPGGAAAAAGCSLRSLTGTWRSPPRRYWTPRRTRWPASSTCASSSVRRRTSRGPGGWGVGGGSGDASASLPGPSPCERASELRGSPSRPGAVGSEGRRRLCPRAGGLAGGEGRGSLAVGTNQAALTQRDPRLSSWSKFFF